MPLVNPVTVHESWFVVQLNPSGLDVTWYDVIGEPLLDAGTSHETLASWLPRCAMTDSGGVGTPAGTTANEAGDAGEVPTALVATTLNV